jgi:S1-C subfamily serine protease
MSPALAEEMQTDSLQKGVVITHVSQTSAAGRLGVQAGDFIVSINGAKVSNVTEAKTELEKGAQKWQLAIRRAGRIMTVTIEG